MVETPSQSPPDEPGLVRALAGLVARTGGHLDRLSLDLARDVGQVTRAGVALAASARGAWHDANLRAGRTWAEARHRAHGVPRVGQVMRAALGLAAAARWARLRSVAAGHPGLTEHDHRALAARARALAIELRGGVLKLGQIASCRPDLVGPIWAEELAALQDRVPAIPFPAIVARLEAELGAPVGERFAALDPEPLAAASLAQVHAGRLLDGRAVAVKVQVPGVDELVTADTAALTLLAPALADLVPGDLPAIAAELGRALAVELDYQAEAEAGAEAAPTFAGTPLFVPAPIAACSTGRVLTSERVEGRRLTDALDAATAAERTRLLATLCGGVARAIFAGGVVHADPHPGNFLVTDDGRIAVLDWGCVLRLTPAEATGYARLMLALATGDSAGALGHLRALGFGGDGPALTAIAASLTLALRPGISAAALDWDAQARAFVADVGERARAARVTVPRSFVLLGRILGTLAGLVARYRPELELATLIGPHVAAAAAREPAAGPRAPAGSA